MVHQSASSLLAEFADDEELGLVNHRSASIKREQPSRVRYATSSRFSRRTHANTQTPSGPRRRLRKAS